MRCLSIVIFITTTSNEALCLVAGCTRNKCHTQHVMTYVLRHWQVQPLHPSEAVPPNMSTPPTGVQDIRFEGHAARVVAERMWRSTQEIRRVNDDGSVVEFHASLAGLEEITRWVLSRGSKARVLGPPELKDRVRREVEAMARG